MAVYHSTQILCKWTHALIITVSVRIMHSYNVRFIHTVSAYAALWGGVFKNTQHYVTVLSESTEMAQIALQTTQHGEEASSSVATQNTFSLCGSDAKWLLTSKENLMMLPVLNCFQNKYWSINLWLLANVTEHLIALPLGGLYLYLLAVEIWFDIVQSEFIEIGCSEWRGPGLNNVGGQQMYWVLQPRFELFRATKAKSWRNAISDQSPGPLIKEPNSEDLHTVIISATMSEDPVIRLNDQCVFISLLGRRTQHTAFLLTITLQTELIYALHGSLKQ